MKRTSLFALIILLCLSFVTGCTPKTNPSATTSAPTSATTVGGTTAATEEDVLRATLAECQWTEGRIFCACDAVAFSLDGIDMYYYPDCGTVLDLTNQRSVTLSSEDKMMIQSVLAPNYKNERVDHSEHEGYTTPIRILQYSEERYGVHIQTIKAGATACMLIDELQKMPETGVVTSKISDQTVDENTSTLQIEAGTWWIEVGSTIYRMSPEMDKISRVETHMGKGYVMAMADGFAELFSDVMDFLAYNHIVTYDNRTETLTYGCRIFEDGDVPHVHVRGINVADDQSDGDSLWLDLISETERTIVLQAHSQHSDDVMGYGDYEEITLIPGKPVTVELGIGGISFSYHVVVWGEGISMYVTVWKPYLGV